MKEKVINFEAQYFINKEKEAQEKLLNKEFKEVLEIVKDPIDKINQIVESDVYCPQNVFETAICLNYLGKEVHQNNLSSINYYDFYLLEGSANYNLGRIQEAKEDYKKAVKLDPASAFSRLFLLKIYKELGEYEDFLTNIQDALYFAYSRPDMSSFYDIAGDYLVHIEDYEMAMVSYHLAMVYNLDDKLADKINDVASKHKINIESHDFLAEDYMKKFYNTYKIPLMPNDRISQLAIAMGQDAQNNRIFEVAKFAYQIAYELTLDESLIPVLHDLGVNVEEKK